MSLIRIWNKIGLGGLRKGDPTIDAKLRLSCEYSVFSLFEEICKKQQISIFYNLLSGEIRILNKYDKYIKVIQG